MTFQFPPHRENVLNSPEGRSLKRQLLFQFPPHRENVLNKGILSKGPPVLSFQFPPHRENVLNSYQKAEKIKLFCTMNCSIFRNLCFCMKHRLVCETTVLEDIPTEIPVLAVRAPVSYGRGRRHFFHFDHSPDF